MLNSVRGVDLQWVDPFCTLCKREEDSFFRTMLLTTYLQEWSCFLYSWYAASCSHLVCTCLQYDPKNTFWNNKTKWDQNHIWYWHTGSNVVFPPCACAITFYVKDRVILTTLDMSKMTRTSVENIREFTVRLTEKAGIYGYDAIKEGYSKELWQMYETHGWWTDGKQFAMT